MKKKHNLNNSAIISIVAIVAIVFGVTLLAPTLNSPTGAVTMDTCGNGEADFGETCGTCPTDIECRDGYSCINEVCEITDLKPKGRQYCGYLPGYYGRDEGNNIAIKATEHTQTCVSKEMPASTASKLTDGLTRFTENVWLCTNTRAPQEATFKLDKEYVVNHVKVFSSNMHNDEFNVKDYTIFTSIDGIHWLEAAEDTLDNYYEGYKDTFFDPVSAQWIKIKVNNVYEAPYDKFGIGEIYVYEATYICDSDNELNWNK